MDTLLIKGEIHNVYCEDAQFRTAIDENWHVAAVMDGCSSGKDSYFASTLLVKLLRKACEAIPHLKNVQTDIVIDNLKPALLGKILLNQVFEQLIRTKKQLELDDLEILSTLILAVYHQKTKQIWINVSGDGFVSINNEIHEIDQCNIPDYMAYNLNLPFIKWLEQHTITYQHENVSNFAIATDGVSKYFSPQKKTIYKNSVAYFLGVKDKKEQALIEKHRELTNNQRLAAYDDISIIRFECEAM